MKRFILVLLVVVFLPVTRVNAQMAVIDAAVLTATTGTWVEQAIYWGQQALAMAEQIYHLKTMIEKMGKQIDNQMQNWKNIKQIHSYKDFMNWHNRQLYLEQMTENAWNNMNVTIGKKSYHISDVEGIGYGLKDTYVDYWNKEFTEEQRRDMWVGLGLTPANYAYVKTWREREQQIAREFLAARAIHVEDYKNEMERNNKKLNDLDEDSKKSDDDPTKMGDKGIAVINAETNIASNKKLNDIEGHLVDMKEQKAVELYQKNTPADEPPMSDWPKDGFQPLKK